LTLKSTAALLAEHIDFARIRLFESETSSIPQSNSSTNKLVSFLPQPLVNGRLEFGAAFRMRSMTGNDVQFSTRALTILSGT
jgi:hypothetical protein